MKIVKIKFVYKAGFFFIILTFFWVFFDLFLTILGITIWEFKEANPMWSDLANNNFPLFILISSIYFIFFFIFSLSMHTYAFYQVNEGQKIFFVVDLLLIIILALVFSGRIIGCFEWMMLISNALSIQSQSFHLFFFFVFMSFFFLFVIITMLLSIWGSYFIKGKMIQIKEKNGELLHKEKEN